jgi:hypothetical protein
MAYLQPSGRAAYASRGLISNVGQSLLVQRQRQREERGLLLAKAVKEGKITVGSLSGEDVTLAGAHLQDANDRRVNKVSLVDEGSLVYWGTLAETL